LSAKLFKAIEKNDEAFLISSINSETLLTRHKGTGRTLLMEASLQGRLNMVDALLNAGAEGLSEFLCVRRRCLPTVMGKRITS
jgi:hypothetical protein